MIVGSRGMRWPVVNGKETQWRFREGYDPYVKKGAGFEFYGDAMKAVPSGDLDRVAGAIAVGVLALGWQFRVPLSKGVAGSPPATSAPAAAQTTYRYARFASDASDQQRPFTELHGVRLMDVLEQAGLAERDRSDWRKAVVIATGRDGSRTVFSWPELAYTAAGTEAMVAYERDVAPLPASEGPLAIHVPGDERRVARDVKQVQRIEVRILRN